MVIGHTWLAEWGRSWPFSARWESAPIWSGGSSRILTRAETKRIVSSENQKLTADDLLNLTINIIFVNFTPTFILTKWRVKSIGDLREICQCVAQREAFVWHECSSWLLVSRVCARVMICVRWPPLRSADAAKYAKLSRLMTSMMGLTTRVWSCTGEREREKGQALPRRRSNTAVERLESYSVGRKWDGYYPSGQIIGYLYWWQDKTAPLLMTGELQIRD